VPILPLALPKGSSEAEEPYAGIARLTNCSARVESQDQRSPLQVWADPGLEGMATISTTGGVRSMLEVDGVVKAVVGRQLYQLQSGGYTTRIGGVPSDGHVGMARNQREVGVQTIIVCDGLAWTEAGGTQTQITDPDLLEPVDVCVVNRSAVFAGAQGRMIRSEIDDASTLDGLDVANAESGPDGLLRVVDRGGEFVAIGQSTFEVWADTGGEAFGFSRAHAARVGAAGARCVTKASVITNGLVTDTVAWLARDQYGRLAGAVMLDGYTARKISTQAQDRLFQAEADPTAIIASSYVNQGQGYITFRLSDRTLIYNTSTQLWHDRQSRTSRGDATTWRVGHMAVLGGRILAGDAASPKLYWIDDQYHDEDGDELVITVRTPPVTAFPGRIRMDRLDVDIVPGVGLRVGSNHDVNPEIMMRTYKDNETPDPERKRLLGATGKRLTRVYWTRLGTFDQATVELRVSAAVARGITMAQWHGGTVRP
jgi:hypothetical protein